VTVKTPGGQTLAGPTSVTIDTTAPLVTLDGQDFSLTNNPAFNVHADTPDVAPTIHIDVDLNHNGTFDDAGERDYALVNSTGQNTTFIIQPGLPEGTYQLRARLSDRAGNEGVSNALTIVIDTHAGYIGDTALRELG